MPERINRRQCAQDVAMLLRNASVSPLSMCGFYLVLVFIFQTVDYLLPDLGIPSYFISILVLLIGYVLEAGFRFYLMSVLRGDSCDYLDLFNGFSNAGRIVLLNLMTASLILAQLFLFFIPGILAMYRYRFALYNLLEHPDMSYAEAIHMSTLQTRGYRMQLFNLDLSFFFWLFLAHLPNAIINTVILYPELFSWENLITPPVIILANGLSLLISLFYIPKYLSMEIRYFETAKRTSGVETPRTGSGRSAYDMNDFDDEEESDDE